MSDQHLQATAPIQADDADMRELREWLNAEPGQSINRAALARVLQAAARYRWMRAAWLEGVEDGTDPVTQQAIQSVQDEDELDAAVDAAIAAGNWPARP